MSDDPWTDVLLKLLCTVFAFVVVIMGGLVIGALLFGGGA